MGNYGYGEEAMPGATLFSYVMFPLRIAFFSFFFCLLYPLMTVVALLRALYLRLVVGTTSQVLKYGTYPPPKPAADGTMMSPPGKHEKANHYPAQMRFTKPFDEAKLKAALVSVAAEDGIPEDQIQLKFMAEVPQEPSSGSYDPGPDLLPTEYKKGYCYSNDIFFPPFGTCTGTQRLLMHVYNGKPGKTTVVHYGGSVCGWDGSSQFNFVKEVMRRYAGLPPAKQFKWPTILPESAAKLDSASFLAFLAKIPINVASNVAGAVWMVTRAARWAGGNGSFAARIVCIDFTQEESAKLAKGAKAMGATVYACWTHAAVKACKEVFKECPTVITNQASLQTRHYPSAGQGKTRDLIGDWLISPVTHLDGTGDFSLAQATQAYKDFTKDLDEVGPATTNALMAKAYGLVNSGAANYLPLPTYNDGTHLMDRCMFMNQYGVREMPAEVGFDAWNWNAPIWLGVNTINVNGKTTTLVGSCMFGYDLVTELRDHMEITLREIMAKA